MTLYRDPYLEVTLSTDLELPFESTLDLWLVMRMRGIETSRQVSTSHSQRVCYGFHHRLSQRICSIEGHCNWLLDNCCWWHCWSPSTTTPAGNPFVIASRCSLLIHILEFTAARIDCKLAHAIRGDTDNWATIRVSRKIFFNVLSQVRVPIVVQHTFFKPSPTDCTINDAMMLIGEVTKAINLGLCSK